MLPSACPCITLLVHTEGWELLHPENCSQSLESISLSGSKAVLKVEMGRNSLWKVLVLLWVSSRCSSRGLKSNSVSLYYIYIYLVFLQRPPFFPKQDHIPVLPLQCHHPNNLLMDEQCTEPSLTPQGWRMHRAPRMMQDLVFREKPHCSMSSLTAVVVSGWKSTSG